MDETITVEVVVRAPLEKVWKAFVDPESVQEWNTASRDWHTTQAENDLRPGGTFSYRMEAKDGSEGFEFGGTYTDVVPQKYIAYTMGDGRMVTVTFILEDAGVRVSETFDPESKNARDMQQNGWQAILDNFKRYVEINTKNDDI